MPARFVLPVLADWRRRNLHVTYESHRARALDVDFEQVAWLSGSVDGLEVARTEREFFVRSPHEVQSVEASHVALEGDLESFIARVARELTSGTSTPRHRATFAALVATRHAGDIDVDDAASLVIGPLWSAARGTPLDRGARERADAALAREVEMADPDRVYFHDVLRVLEVLRCAMGDSPADLVRAALALVAGVSVRDLKAQASFAERWTSSVEIQREARWLAVLSGALARLDEVDPIAVETLACALGPVELGTRVLQIGGWRIRFEVAIKGRSRILIDGRRCRVRTRSLVTDENDSSPNRSPSEWSEADDADLSGLVGALEDKELKRTERDGCLVLERYSAGLSGFSATSTFRIRVADGVLVVDVEDVTHPTNPYVGW